MIRIQPMELKHLDEVYAIELDSFSIPWSKQAIREEILDTRTRIYLVALDGDTVIGYAGMWHVVTEGHITNVAVHPEHRRRGAGDALIRRMAEIGEEKEMIGLTLEVRMGNEKAMKLYSKHGFIIEGIRKNYYEDTKEDAIIMWKYFNPKGEV